jgi:light-regulated signal transduction histidine kinase (bacteriophytochrome)
LEKAHVELEQRVEERTAELAKTAEELTRYSAELEDFSKSVSLRIMKVLNEVRDDLDEIEPHISADFKKGQSLIDKANGLQKLITSIVWYTASKAKIQKLEEVNGSRVLHDVKQDLKPEINKLDATVDCDSLPTILFNREKLFILFRCLLSNAIKFHGQSAPIVSIKAEQEDNKWVFSIQDNGIGIHSAYIDKVFNVWSRTHNAVQYPGEGIGLAICKNILEYNNERIWLDSEPGRGSTFHFTVPATGDAR